MWIIVAVGLVGLAAWLYLAPPTPRAPLRSAIRLCVVVLLAAAFLNPEIVVGPGTSPRLAVLVDTSLSMEARGLEGRSRAEAARDWIDGPALDELKEEWDVTIDSFGGATTDLGDAIESAASGLPSAIVIVSDGRAAGGRAAEPPGVPLFVVPVEPHDLADGAIVDLRVEDSDDETAEVVVEIGAVGGLPLVQGRSIVVEIEGDPSDRIAMTPGLSAGEKEVLRVPLGDRGAGQWRITARLEPEDGVPRNDQRSIVWNVNDEPGRILVVGLRPGWEFGAWVRALRELDPMPADGYWTADGARLKSLSGETRAADWNDLSGDRYRAVFLIGDPGLLSDYGRRWLDGFLARGGRGVYWSPGAAVGLIPGTGIEVPGPPVADGPPRLTDAGAEWLRAQGGLARDSPDGGADWPDIEGISATSPSIPSGAEPLIVAAGRPIAWAIERGATRQIVALGTGYYRWGLAPSPAGGEEFWQEWTATVTNWLTAVRASDRSLVFPPGRGRARYGESVEMRIPRGVEGTVTWEVEREEDGRLVADGVVTAGAGPRRVVIGPLNPGDYSVSLETQAGESSVRFVVEEWAPDVARTSSDTVSLGSAARISGGALLVDSTNPLLELAQTTTEPIGPSRTVGLGTRPWVFLLAALGLLAEWALAQRSLTGRREAG